MSSQKPCFETFVISTSEVPVPCGTDFILMLLYQVQCRRHALVGESKVLSQLNGWFQPEFCLAARVLNVNMHPQLLARKEEKAIALLSEYRGAHQTIVANSREGTKQGVFLSVTNLGILD
jgi:hypothetical protein